MSDAASKQKIRLGEVASALDVDAKLIRNWLRTGQFDLLRGEEKEAQKWREFSFLDVAHLAVAMQAIRYGFTVSEAHDFAGMALVNLVGADTVTARNLDRLPGGALQSLARGKSLFLFKLSDGQTVAFCDWMRAPPRYHGAVHIDLEMAIGMPFRALADMGHDPFESSHPKEYPEFEASALKEELENAE